LNDDFEKFKIDSSLWQSKFKVAYNYPMVNYYHTHQVFDRYPVVNISYYGAVKYCEWLTKRYKQSLKKRKVIFKLPSEQEWILLSNSDPSTKLPYNVLTGKNAEGCYVENINL